MKKNLTELQNRIYKKYLTGYFSGLHNLPEIDKEYEKAYWLWRPYLTKYLRNLSRINSQILDVGCGLGHGLYTFKSFGFKYIYGIDINAEAVSFVKKKGFNAINADVFSFLKNKHTQYDVISLFDVIEHFSRDEIIPLLSLLKQALKKNGLLINQTLNAGYPFSAKNFYWDITHETFLTGQSLGDFLRLAGFKDNDIISINGMHRYHPNFLIRLLRIAALDTVSTFAETFHRLLALSQGVFLSECRPFLISVSRKT